MKKSLSWALVIIFILQLTSTVRAQDPIGKKYNNPQWKRISLTSYKSGQLARAKEIIQNYHGKASEKAGTPRPAMIIDLVSGDWDVMTVWDMPEGLEEFN